MMVSGNRRAGQHVIWVLGLALLACPVALDPRLSSAAEPGRLLTGTGATTDPHSEVLRGPSERLDSRSCLGCHDGAVASNVLNKVCAISLSLPDRWGRGDRGQRGSHPIGANYQLAKALRPTARLKDIALLPAVIKLEHGSTGCLSCHDPASSYPHMLVIDNTGSRLCYACHDM